MSAQEFIEKFDKLPDRMSKVIVTAVLAEIAAASALNEKIIDNSQAKDIWTTNIQWIICEGNLVLLEMLTEVFVECKSRQDFELLLLAMMEEAIKRTHTNATRLQTLVQMCKQRPKEAAE